MPCLSGLTVEEIKMTFEKTLAENKIEQGRVDLIGADRYEKVLEFLRDEFYPSEYISQSLNIKWDFQIANFYLNKIKQNFSLMMLDWESGDIMGVCIMSLSTLQDDDYVEDWFDQVPMKQMIAFWKFCDAKTRFFDRYQTMEAIDLLGLSVGRRYRRKGVGSYLVETALKFLKNLKMSPIYVKADATSPYAYRIFEKFGFDLNDEIRFGDFKWEGNIVIRSTNDYYCMKMCGLSV